MWPFDRKPTRQEPAALPPGPDFAAIARRIDQLERGHEKLVHQLTEIDVSWSEWFDKFRRLYARIAKRQERDEKDADELETSREVAPGRTIVNGDISQHGGPRIPRRNY